MTTEISFRILEDIARDLSGEIVSFPTFLDITFQVRTALKKPDLTVAKLGTLLSAEPMMSTKIIRLANSVALNPSGRSVTDISSAIVRVGMEAVRSASFAVAMEQLLNSKKMLPFAALSRRLWEHSIYVAALSRVLARKLTRVNPDEAMFAGLIHDIGVFYLLSRAVSFPELIAKPAELHELLMQWHAEIGHALLAAMGLPDDLLLAVQTHETERPIERLATLADVVWVANKLANLKHSWSDPALVERADAGLVSQLFDASALATLLAESADELASLRSALGT